MNDMEKDIKELSSNNSPLSSYWHRGFQRGYDYKQREIEQAGACEFIADNYGLDEQLNQLQEECGELVQAINKRRRTGSAEGVIEEMADVEIMLTQIKYLLKCSEKVQNIKIEKLCLELKRIGERKKSDDGSN